MTTPENEGTSQPTPARHPEGQQGPGAETPLLTAHATLVFVTAVLIAAVAGVLTYFSAGNTAGALLASLTAGAASAPVLHKLIGR
ncbi:hypothetical protein ACFTUC_39000 [Streptomyces sp. NPDC056944]|uniref:hypothetical protein n=1 Tax=unclassified Streptomyces TaxID=2593676 RepID=UPI00362EEC30